MGVLGRKPEVKRQCNIGQVLWRRGERGATREVGKGCAGSPRSFLCLGGAGPVVHVRVPGLLRAHGVHLRLSDPNYG